MRQKEEWIIDYLDGNLDEMELLVFKEKLSADPELMLELQQIQDMDEALAELPIQRPSQAVSDTFYKFLENENSVKPKGKVVSLGQWKNIGIAASILICGICIGFFNQESNVNTPGGTPVKVDSNNLSYVNLLEESSPMKRIKGIHETNKVSNPTLSMIQLLGKTLKEDPSSNVRLAAAKALGNQLDYEEARICLVEALASEEDPSVKIEIINILSLTRDRRVIDPLNKVIENDNDMKFVKDEAQKGLLLINNAY